MKRCKVYTVMFVGLLHWPTLMPSQTREVLSCDHFLDAIADPDLELKIRECQLSDLDSERSNLAVSARTSGEVHLFQGRESVDGLTAPPLAQKTGNVQELLCPEQTRSLEPLVISSKVQLDRASECPEMR